MNYVTLKDGSVRDGNDTRKKRKMITKWKKIRQTEEQREKVKVTCDNDEYNTMEERHEVKKK